MSVEVGQKLWLVRGGWRNSDRPSEKEVTVTKVGRKWFYVEDPEYNGWKQERYDLENMVEDAGQYTPKARCYLSKADYDYQNARRDRWDIIHRWMGYAYRCPDGVTLDQLDLIAGILGIPKKLS